MAIGKILCIGDSLTVGDESNAVGHRGYRGALQVLLANAGYTVNFLGTQSLAPAAGGSDPEHDGYDGARMDSSDSASNSIEGRVSTIRTAVGAVDIIILGIGWEDAIAGTSSADTKFSDLLTTIRTGDWASAKIVMLTLHPEQGKTVAQTGSSYAAYATINAQVRAEADSNHIVADLAALTGSAGDLTAMIETLLYDAQHGPDYSTTGGGGQLPSLFGGHEHTSFKSIQDFCAEWSTNPPWPRVGGNGSTGDMLNADPSIAGHPTYINSVCSIVPWFWAATGPGHNAVNTGIEVRNAWAQGWNGATNQWEFFFQGARMGGDWASYTDAPWGASDGAGTLNVWRPDGITSLIKPTGNIAVEVWPEDTVPSRGVLKFLGGKNRTLMANSVCFAWACQVRLALVDPYGANDINKAVLQACMGADFFADNGYDTHYDYYGWPLTAADGGHDRWKRIVGTEWMWIGGIAIGSGTDGHFEDPGLKPPLGYEWSPATPYNDIPTYSKTAAQIRANPPKFPTYVDGATGSSAGWLSSDYYDTFNWTQQGADKAARVIYDAMVAAGLLTSFTGGGPIAPSLLPGIPTVGKWNARYTTETTDPDTATWAAIGPTQNVAPSWPSPYGLPLATSGTAYTATLSAYGIPAPTYSHVSGKPSWMSVASNGDITGTPNETADAYYSITFRASNSVDDTDITLSFRVVIGPTILTTSLPGAAAGESYLQQLLASGSGALTWTVVSGSSSLAACGLSLSANGFVSGTVVAGTATFTVRATDAAGEYDEQAYTVVFGSASAAPAITTTVMVSGTVGISYSATIAVTGSGTIARRLIAGAIPPGTTLTENTGVVAGTPTSSGTFVFTVQPESEYGTGTPVTLSITVFSASSIPTANPFARLFGGV